MVNLIKLELKRFNLNSKLFIASICNLCILGITNLIFFVEQNDFGKSLESYNILINLSVTLIFITFMVYSSVLISDLIISEYKNKTITLLFTYPIDRKKIILSKLILIFMFTFFNIIVSSIFVLGTFYIIQVITRTLVVKLSLAIVFERMIIITISALKNSVIALIPLFFGLKTKSTSITIISGLLLAGVLHSTSNGFNLSSIVIIPIILIVMSVLIIYSVLKNIDKTDTTL